MYVNAQRSPRAPPYQAATLTRSRTRPGGATTVTRYQARRQGLNEGGHPTPYLARAIVSGPGSRLHATVATRSPRHPHPRSVATAHAGRPPPSPAPPPRGETPRRHTRTHAPLEHARAPRTSRTPQPPPVEPAARVPPRAGLPRAPPRLVWQSHAAAAERRAAPSFAPASHAPLREPCSRPALRAVAVVSHGRPSQAPAGET